MHRDLIYNGRNLSDFDLCINELDISPPKKVAVKKVIPYMSGYYDYSRLYGAPVFENRELKYTVDLIEDTEVDLASLKMRVINWLMSGEMGELIDTAYEGWFFTAECVSIQDADEVEKAVFTIIFDAQPFMQRSWYAGDPLWDPFCFETDTLQDTTFTVSGSLTTEIGAPIMARAIAQITVSADMTLTFVGEYETLKYSIKKGTATCSLPIGRSTLTIVGTGTLEILFREMML